MGLSSFYEFTAPANTSASELEKFLRAVEHEANALGFNPTTVQNVTDERGCEMCFGFFKFSEHIIGIPGAILADTGLNGRWWFLDFISSPDPRYRTIVGRFSERGFVRLAKDEFS